MPRQSSDDRDNNDNTDELPVLLETVALEDATAPEDTAQHAALYETRAEEPSHSAALRTDLALRSAKIEELEGEVARLKERCQALEGQLAPKEASIRDLGRTLAAMRQSAEAQTAAERQLAAQLADREAHLRELAGNDKQLRSELQARAIELDRLRAAALTAQRGEAARKEHLTQREPVHGDPAAQQLREDNAALTAYIAGRRHWWDELEAAHTALAARVASLDHELATNVARRKRAEAFAEQETQRATGLRAELVELAHRLEIAEREIALARREPQQQRQRRAPEQAAPVPAAAAEPVTGETAAGSAVTTSPAETEPAFEIVAQLEGQVEFKRQQVAAQLVELRDREQRLRAATLELDRLRGELGTLRADLDRSKTDAARLERAVLDKDRAIEARDARIATLQDELNQRLGALQKQSAPAPSPPTSDTRAPERSRGVEPNVESVHAPALICLTGEAPKRFALSKKNVTVGRGAHCDLQVMTHFVSREHARLSLAGDRVVIEDLGSRNGVFVNSVRVDRQELRHGDLITIGETQFRFVESMAH
jgi:chromosome segregation ATPase